MPKIIFENIANIRAGFNLGNIESGFNFCLFMGDFNVGGSGS